MDFSFDGTVLASCSFDGLLRLWDTSTGHCLKTLAIDNGDHPLSCVTFSPNGARARLRCLLAHTASCSDQRSAHPALLPCRRAVFSRRAPTHQANTYCSRASTASCAS
jgi:WD40 repeat protein